jgi:hypothetical protein
MDDKMSIVLATAVLAFSGIGLYMYKQTNNEDDDDNTYVSEFVIVVSLVLVI